MLLWKSWCRKLTLMTKNILELGRLLLAFLWWWFWIFVYNLFFFWRKENQVILKNVKKLPQKFKKIEFFVIFFAFFIKFVKNFLFLRFCVENYERKNISKKIKKNNKKSKIFIFKVDFLRHLLYYNNDNWRRNIWTGLNAELGYT